MIYDYFCPFCNERFDGFSTVANREHSLCPKCGKQADKIFSLPKTFGVSYFQPFITDNITGKPVSIESKSQLTELLTTNGLKPRDIQWQPGDKYLTRWI